MGVLDDVAAGTADVVKAAAQLLVGRTTLVYQAGFANRAMDPVVDLLHLGPLHLTQSATLDGDPLPPKLEMVPAQPAQGKPAGARLKLQRPSDADGIPLRPDDLLSVDAVVHPFPPGLDLFLLTARFEIAEGPHGVPDAWACVLQARKGDIPDTITDRRDRIVVTLQTAFNGAARDSYGARMNTPGGARAGTPFPIPQGTGAGTGEWVPEGVRDAVYSREPYRSQFELEMLVDRRADIGRAGLRARHHSVPYSERRWFVHELIGISRGNITTAGFALAIAGGNGPVAVTITDFRIYTVRRGVLDVLGTLPVVGNAVAGVLNDMRT